MKNLYNFYVDKNPRFTNYYQKLSIESKRKPSSPVILIFDNELVTGKKPLFSFASYADLKGNKLDLLKENLSIRIIGGANLFLVTNPLVNGKDECEIEDLFDADTLGHTIGGKSFSKDDKADKDKYYGKEIFANYVQSSYLSVNFANFKPMLDNIAKIVNDYATEIENNVKQ